jgi:hypothetical protein
MNNEEDNLEIKEDTKTYKTQKSRKKTKTEVSLEPLKETRQKSKKKNKLEVILEPETKEEEDVFEIIISPDIISEAITEDILEPILEPKIIVEDILEAVLEPIPEPKIIIEDILEPILETIMNPEHILEPKIVLEDILELITIPENINLETINKPLCDTILNGDSETDFLNKIEFLLYYIKCSIGGSGIITSINIVSIVNNLIHNVEKYDTLKGQDKKMLIINTLKKYINEQNSNYCENTEENLLEKKLLLMFIDNTLSQLIDTIVYAINGKNKFIKTKQTTLYTAIKKLFCYNKN